MTTILRRSRTTKDPLPREVWILASASFVIALGFGLVAPVLPQYALSFGVGVTAATFIISAFAAMRLLFAPWSASLVQRLGERSVYTTGLLIVALSTGACGFAQVFWQLLVFRSLGGIGSTMFTVSALALMVRIAPPKVRGRVAGLYGMSFLVGSVGGPLVGSALAGFGLSAPFLIYASVLFIVAAVVHFSLRNSSLISPLETESRESMTLRDALKNKAFQSVLGSSFVNGWAIFGVRMAVVPLFVKESLDGNAQAAGIALTVFAVGNALVLMPAGKLSDRYGRKPFLVSGMFICGIGTLAMGFSATLTQFFAMSLLAGIGAGLLNPSQQAAVADIVGNGVRGGPVFAAFQMLSDVGAVVGPLISGYLAEVSSYATAFIVTSALLFVMAAVWLATPETLHSPSAAVIPSQKP
ncbi:MAG: MFS transporter [Mycobacteriaceae bacterium]